MGKQNRCKECDRAQAKARREAYRKANEGKNPYEAKSHKMCSTCKGRRQRASFWPNPRTKDGLSPRCKHCSKDMVNKWISGSRSIYLERARQRSKKNYLKDPKKALDKVHKRRARIHSAKVGESPLFQEMWDNQEGRCFYCGVDLATVKVHEEHRTPLSKGGAHSKANVCLACAPCNREKGTKTEKEYLQARISPAS